MSHINMVDTTPEPIDIGRLSAFVTVARAGSISRAATVSWFSSIAWFALAMVNASALGQPTALAST